MIAALLFTYLSGNGTLCNTLQQNDAASLSTQAELRARVEYIGDHNIFV